MPVTDLDERRHPVEDTHEHWSDSLYFNGFDLATGACFLTRMAVLANQPSANALWLAWLDGEPAYGYYRVTKQLPEADWDATSIDGVTYRMIEPRRRWTLALDDGDDKAFLEFDGFSPCFDYADNREPLPRAVAWGHFEQSGTVRGDLHLGEHRIAFDGVGQRDHSWGFRQWDGVREWHWVTGLLGTTRSFNLFHVVDGQGCVSASGYVYDAGTARPIVGADRRTREGDGRVPEGYELTLEVEGGRVFEFAARRSHTSVALRPGSTTVQEVPMHLASDGLEGVGVYELLFNAVASA